MALTFVVTRFIQIPIPLGYFNVGNSVILLGCVFVPLPYGIAIGGLASALADLTSYPIYTIPTLIIKSLMPLVFYGMKRIAVKSDFWKNVVAASICTLIPLFGYTLTGCIIAGNFVAGVAQFPGLFVEYIANLIIFGILFKALNRVIKKEV